MYDEADKAKITANPANEKGVVSIDLRNNDKLRYKTLPDKTTEITFTGGDRSKLVVKTDT